jgi:hypothetical protein
VGISAAPGCAKGRTQTPEELRDAWAHALEHDDVDAAWKLLSPEAQSQIGKEAFAERWRSDAAERKDQLAAISELDKAASTAVIEGRTTHAGGRELRWTLVDGRFYVRDGLPGLPSTMTAESTIRAFIEALRRAKRGDFEGLVQAELLDGLAESWATRADAIEEALETPGALELSQDYGRATLRYGKGGAITLERTEMGWRVSDLR